MEWFKILALCLSCFALGSSITGLVLSVLEYRRADRRVKQIKARWAEREKREQELKASTPPERGCFNCKHTDKPLTDKHCHNCDIKIHSKWEPKEDER